MKNLSLNIINLNIVKEYSLSINSCFKAMDSINYFDISFALIQIYYIPIYSFFRSLIPHPSDIAYIETGVFPLVSF